MWWYIYVYIYLFFICRVSSRILTRTAMATSRGMSLKQSGTISLTSASLENWTRTSKSPQIIIHHKISNVSMRSQPNSSFSRRDGKISREEMIDYFMKASSLLNCKMGFIHTFTETTYVKPTFCEHCAGFVRKLLLLTVTDHISLSELMMTRLRPWAD